MILIYPLGEKSGLAVLSNASCSIPSSGGLAGKERRILPDNGGRFRIPNSPFRFPPQPRMRYRLLPNFEGEAEGVSTNDPVKELFEKTPIFTEAAVQKPVQRVGSSA